MRRLVPLLLIPLLLGAELTNNREVPTRTTRAALGDNATGYLDETAMSRDDLTDARSRTENVLVDVPPSATAVGKLIYRTGDQSYYRTRAVGGITPAKATFENYTDRAFIGNFAALSDLPNANASPNQGTWAWVYGEFQAYRSIRNTSTNQFEWVDVDVNRIVAGVDYIGHYANDDLATPHVTQVGDLYNDDTLNVLKAAATFTAQSGSPTRYEQDKVLTIAGLPERLPPYENIKLVPEGLPGATWPTTLLLQVGHKNDPDQLTKLEVVHGNTVIYTQSSAAALAILNTSVRGLIKIELPIGGTKATLDTASARQGTSSIGLGLVFTFGTREVLENITIPVNSALYATGGGGGIDSTARAEASAAQKLATENKGRLDGIPVYAGELAVWPPNVRKHSDFQRSFQSTLSGLDPALATNAGSTGTRFTNVFRIFTHDADGDVVQLHTQGWSFTNDQRQTIPWEVSAAEFNQLGTETATNGLEVWGEFRAVYGGGVNEGRGRTNPIFIDFGEQPSWPATRGEVPIRNTTTAPRVIGDAGDFGATGQFADGGHTHQLQLLPGGGLAFDAQNRLQVTGTAVAQLNVREQIGLLNLFTDPGSISYTNSTDLATLVKTIRVNIANPEVLTKDAWVQGWIQGQPGQGARVKVTSSTAGVTITLPDANADAVASALITDNDPHVEVRLRFYDAVSAGNEIERIGYNVPIIDVSKQLTDAQVARIPKAPMILQAAVDAANTAGVNSFTLPANYANWRWLHVEVWEGNGSDIATITLRTSVLTVQSDGRHYLVARDTTQGRNSVQLAWNSTARTMTKLGQGIDRIIYAELHD